MKKYLRMWKIINLTLGITALAVFLSVWFSGNLLMAQEKQNSSTVQQKNTEQKISEPGKTVSDKPQGNNGLAFLAAALATGLGSIGAGLAISSVGAAALGAISEKPELLGKALIFVALAEGIAIYGLLISILILART